MPSQPSNEFPCPRLWPDRLFKRHVLCCARCPLGLVGPIGPWASQPCSDAPSSRQKVTAFPRFSLAPPAGLLCPDCLPGKTTVRHHTPTECRSPYLAPSRHSLRRIPPLPGILAVSVCLPSVRVWPPIPPASLSCGAVDRSAGRPPRQLFSIPEGSPLRSRTHPPARRRAI